MKKRIILAIIIILPLIALYWLSSYAYLEITVDGSPEGNTVTIRNQKSLKSVTLDNVSTSNKRLVKKGSYEIDITKGETSFFSVNTTGRFLSTTTVRGTLEEEKSRIFIGNNPDPCTHLVNNLLVSFVCGGAYDDIQIHNPATADQPTFNNKNPNVSEATIIRMVRTKQGGVALVKEPILGGDSEGDTYSFFPIKEDLEQAGGIIINETRDNLTYDITPFKDGFLLFDSAFEQLRYFASVSAAAEEIKIERPEGKNLQPLVINTRGDTIAIAYSDNTEGDVSTLDADEGTKGSTTVVIYRNDESTTFRFKQPYSSIKLCGEQKLCALVQNRLEVFDTSGDKQKLVFSVTGVNQVEVVADELIIIRDLDVLGINVEKRSGSIQYSLGLYGSCGIQAEPTSYTLCLTNIKQKKVALSIDPLKVNTDSIDKKINELMRLQDITDVSAYRNFIYISPKFGKPAYDPATNSYDYNAIVKKQVNDQINQKISELGINRGIYTIINTFE
ncbi:hypothetical protein H0X10_01340 [Candidatus Saccharibacteria bacterium]|nr:hypothetical protein [Candidatus Saccharibacteria bacterium]